MPDEESGATATATDTASTHTSASTSHATGGGGGGGGLGGGRQAAKLPHLLSPGQSDPDPMSLDEHGMHPPRWISYLQQMLNYHYQTEVCNDNGEFDGLTARAVSHFREQNHLGPGETVDIGFWNKLGIEDAPDQPPQGAGHQQGGGQQGGGEHGGGQQGGGEFSGADHSAALVDLPDSSMSWAASLAIALNSKGNSYSVDSLCEHVQATKEQKSWSDASQIGANQGMFWVSCNGNTAEAWGAALQNGLLWVPNPTNDTHMFVVAGIRQTGDHAEIHVLDAQHGTDVWVSMHEFTEYYGMTDGYYGELLAIA